MRLRPLLIPALGLAAAAGLLLALMAPADRDRLLGRSPSTSPAAKGPAATASDKPDGAGRAEAEQSVATAWASRAEALRPALAAEWEAKSIRSEGRTLRWLEQRFGDKPAAGWNLFISLHGGGGAPAYVNDQQWGNQIRLYRHPGSIFVAPRAPTDNWNLWHEGHVDGLLDRLIAAAVVTQGVNPDRVYLLGYSAGGDGAYQLGPRMADRFAAAAMMAGHPNEASPLGLRNLPFAIWCGGEDGAYDRNKVAAEWLAKLAELAAADPGGYVHSGKVVPGKGHWMDLEDAAAVPWMAGFTRDPWPKSIVWRQDDVLHRRFYWLEIPEGVEVDAGEVVRARVDGQVISVETSSLRDLTLRLSDRLVDLDRPITVKARGKVVFEGLAKRDPAVTAASLLARPDPSSAATAELILAW